MRKTRSKMIALLVVTAIATVSFISTGQAAATKQKLDVWFGQNNVSYNNQDVTAQVAPIVVNGYTYLPLRNMANLFNKDIAWDQSTKTAVLSDRADNSVIDLKNQIIAKDAYIQTLEEKIRKLENDTSSSSSSMSDLEDSLNNDYDSYQGASFKISLSGDKKDITATIKTDKTDWNDISSSKQKSYLQDVVDEILKEFKNANIDGKVKDGSTTLTTFSVSSSGTVKIDSNSSSSSSSSSSVSSLKSKLKSKLNSDYFGTLSGIDNADLSIDLDGDTNDLTFTINIDLSTYQSEWDSLSDSKIKNYMKAVYNYIVDQSSFTDTSVDGYFYDEHGDDKLAKLSTSGTFTRY